MHPRQVWRLEQSTLYINASKNRLLATVPLIKTMTLTLLYFHGLNFRQGFSVHPLRSCLKKKQKPLNKSTCSVWIYFIYRFILYLYSPYSWCAAIKWASCPSLNYRVLSNATVTQISVLCLSFYNIKATGCRILWLKIKAKSFFESEGRNIL